ncbi:MAG: UDP-N-acetylglucosamine 2-epimerase (non-hydrolyzing) [archaeon]
MEGKTAIVFGTRPEIIKLAPVIKQCQKKGIPFFTVHSGQHYSYEMDSVFFEQLGLEKPDYRLAVKSKAPYMQGQHTGKMMEEIEQIILKEKPSNVVAEGDTNTVLATALVTAKIGTVKQLVDFSPKFGHVEACLRSYDKTMPEEMNRVIADHVSNYLFAPTENAKQNALKEGLSEKKIFVTGNTIVDALKMVGPDIEKANSLERLGLEEKNFALLTLHRQENVDVREKLQSILSGVSAFCKKSGLEALWPMHPRAKKMLGHFGIPVPEGIRAVEPLGFFEFLSLEKNAAIALTDSGGVQEESCIFGTKCVTLRENTERPETVSIGANVIAGWREGSIVEHAGRMLAGGKNWKQPFGDGNASKKIMEILEKGCDD